MGQKGGGDTNAGPHSAGGQEDGPAERRAGQVRSGRLSLGGQVTVEQVRGGVRSGSEGSVKSERY